MASFSILHFSYIFAPCEMELKPIFPSLENFHGWVQENDDPNKSWEYRFRIVLGMEFFINSSYETGKLKEQSFGFENQKACMVCVFDQTIQPYPASLSSSVNGGADMRLFFVG